MFYMYIEKKNKFICHFFFPLQMLGSDNVIDIEGPSFSNRQTRVRNVQVSPSQSSINISESPCTQESGFDGGLWSCWPKNASECLVPTGRWGYFVADWKVLVFMFLKVNLVVYYTSGLGFGNVALNLRCFGYVLCVESCALYWDVSLF